MLKDFVFICNYSIVIEYSNRTSIKNVYIVLVEQAMASSDSLTQLLLEEFEAKEREVFGDASVEEGYSGLLPFESVKDALKALSEEMLGLSPYIQRWPLVLILY